MIYQKIFSLTFFCKLQQKTIKRYFQQILNQVQNDGIEDRFEKIKVHCKGAKERRKQEMTSTN